jgi:D-glycero-D-manno-heptose 1,7-bisphosphate phosphatase
MKWAVFLDRDGTINEEVEYLHNPEELRLIPDAAEAIHLLNQAKAPAILVTNQAGIGRGYYSEVAMQATHRELASRLAAGGAYLDAIYHCPHRPDEECDCRKPMPGMLKRAAEEHGIDLQRSFVVGDKVSDLEAGRRAGCRTVLVLTGYGPEEREALKSLDFQPDHIGVDLLDAVRWILAQAGAER